MDDSKLIKDSNVSGVSVVHSLQHWNFYLLCVDFAQSIWKPNIEPPFVWYSKASVPIDWKVIEMRARINMPFLPVFTAVHTVIEMRARINMLFPSCFYSSTYSDWNACTYQHAVPSCFYSSTYVYACTGQITNNLRKTVFISLAQCWHW